MRIDYRLTDLNQNTPKYIYMDFDGEGSVTFTAEEFKRVLDVLNYAPYTP